MKIFLIITLVAIVQQSLCQSLVPKGPILSTMPDVPAVPNPNDTMGNFNHMVYWSTMFLRNANAFRGIDKSLDSTVDYIYKYISTPVVINGNIINIEPERKKEKLGFLTFVPENQNQNLSPMTEKNIAKIPTWYSKFELFLLVTLHECGHIQDYCVYGENPDDSIQYLKGEIKQWEREILLFDQLKPGYLDNMATILGDWQKKKFSEISSIIEESFSGQNLNQHDLAIVGAIILMNSSLKKAKTIEEKMKKYVSFQKFVAKME